MPTSWPWRTGCSPASATRATRSSSRRSRCASAASTRCRTNAEPTASADRWAVTDGTASRGPRLSAAMRTGGRVMPLELFFDLVFVLGLTQCTAFMADEPTWEGLAKGLLILGILWWSWIGYSWLTSVVDPEEGGVRLVLIAAMAAMLVVALAIPEAFG